MTLFKKRAMSATKGLNMPIFVVIIAFFVVLFQASSVSAYAENMSGTPAKGTEFINLAQGQSTTFKATFKNTGTKKWTANRVAIETGDFLKSSSLLKHSAWLNYYRPASLTKDVLPNQSVTLSFYVLAPSNLVGDIQQNFQLVDNSEQPIKGALVRLFVNITKPVTLAKTTANTNTTSTVKPVTTQASTLTNNVTTYTPTNTSSATTIKTNVMNSAFLCSATGIMTTEQIAQYANCNTAAVEKDSTNGQSAINQSTKVEPIMRVGLFNTTFAQRVQSASIVDVNGGGDRLFSGVAAGEVMTVGFDFTVKQYSISVAGMTKYSFKPIRLIPRTPNAVATLIDYRNGAVGSGTLKDNRYRNIIELQYSAKTCKLWLINELPLGYYLKGLGETSNASPVEFQKVMLSAARTYAMYHYNRGVENKIIDGSTKHADEHFHVDSTYDQVYRGYGSEERMPTLVTAENQTRGLIVTYQGKVAITPYFSRSDGRTRSWTEVWGGAGMPWLVTVPVPQDAGQGLLGHGVGMSARGALLMVVNEKKPWDTVIRYFYKGVDIQKVY